VEEADPQVGLGLERLLGRAPAASLAGVGETGLQLEGAARHQAGALGELGTIGLDLGRTRPRGARDRE
jgi:hypothetical protein